MTSAAGRIPAYFVLLAVPAFGFAVGRLSRMRRDSILFAFSSSARRDALRPWPARLIKYVSIRIPDCGPFGETFFEANVRAIVLALFVNSPGGGCVESVLTLATHLFRFRVIVDASSSCSTPTAFIFSSAVGALLAAPIFQSNKRSTMSFMGCREQLNTGELRTVILLLP